MTATSSTSLPSSTTHDDRDRISRGRLKYLFGRPLATDEAPHQAISKKVGLAVFASDALSSVAYATQEILIVLAAIGMTAFGISIPIAITITLLLAILTVSYRQTIFAYPGGGGAYIVARDNIGEAAAQVAGAALLTDYVLTVAVSVSSGVDQIASAFPAVKAYEAAIAIIVIVLMTYVNLRGVKESGAVFALPTYFFIGTIFLTLIVGALRHFTGLLGGLATVNASTIEMVKRTAEPLGAFP